MPADIHIRKTIAGALLFGASALTGNATLMASAGALGVNWTSEALASIWQQMWSERLPDTPVTRAAAHAIRQAADTLKKSHQKRHGSRADLRAFDLIRDCADSIADAAQQPPDSMLLVAAEEALSSALSELLQGHDERAVAFIKRELLGEVARAFRQQLTGDTKAWQSFYGLLIERMARQVEAMGGRLERLQTLYELISQQRKALEVLAEEASVTAATVSFENTDLETKSLKQAAFDIIEGQGTAPTPSRSTGPSVSFTNNRVRADTVEQAGNSIYKDATKRQYRRDSEHVAPSNAPSPAGGHDDQE